jgi:hypothetical protein
MNAAGGASVQGHNDTEGALVVRRDTTLSDWHEEDWHGSDCQGGGTRQRVC